MPGYLIFILGASLLFAPVSAAAGTVTESGSGCIPVRSVSEDSLAFHAGEYLKFTMHYEWGVIDSDVGWATVNLDSLTFNGEDAFLCKVYGQTTRLFDLFFKVREDFRSWFTRDGLRPLRFTRDTYEGRYEARNDYVYMWDMSGESRILADVYSSSSGQRYVELPLDGCTYDLHFILRGRETKKVKGLGMVNTIRFSAKLLAGNVFTGEEDLTIWITDDENRIPVLFEAPILVGTASGRLKEWSGLRHPFSSLVKRR